MHPKENLFVIPSNKIIFLQTIICLCLKNNLVFASASFHPKRKFIGKNKKEIIEREKDYLFFA